MPKCPKCNRLFTGDETLCSNCEAELIEFDSSALVVFKEVDKKPQAQKFVKFLHYSNVASAVYEYNEENETWSILVKESDLKQTKKLYDAFYTVEMENAQNHIKQEVIIQSTDSTEPDAKANDSTENDFVEDVSNPVDNASVESYSSENSSVENDSTENSSVENDSMESNSAENDSVESSSTKNDSAESSSVEDDSVENSSLENSSLENSSAESISLENDSVESNSAENDSTENKSVERDAQKYPSQEKIFEDYTSDEHSLEKETFEHDHLDTGESSESSQKENNRTHNEEHPENYNTEHTLNYEPENAEITTPEEENYLREEFNISDAEKEEEYLFDQEEVQDLYNDDPKRPEKTQTYIKKEEQYKDLISSAFSFLVISILGILLLIINAVGIISIFNGTMTYIVMGGLFLVFLYIGITTLIKSNKVKGQIGEENQVTNAINTWLSLNVTKESLNELVNPKDGEEIQFIQKIERMKELIIKQFGEMDDL
jgi:RNA polymerase subunit RPABC4/transcription elongation factor Spt4